jgi:ketosteroid isomerase-like protein
MGGEREERPEEVQRKGRGGETVDAGSGIPVVQAVFEAFHDRDLGRLIELMDPEVELFAPTAALAHEGRCYRGHDGIARYLQDVERIWSSLRVEPEKFREVGNHVVCLGQTRARGQDGIEVDSPTAWVWELRAGKLRWGCVYADPGSTFMGLSFGAGAEAPCADTPLPPGGVAPARAHAV